MSSVTLSGRGTLGDRQVYRLGYGAMQLAGPGVFGPPKDLEEAVRVLQAAVEAGINHIDTSDFYGPHVTNQLIRKALHPYPDDLCIVTKVSARRDEKGNWLPAMSPAELTQAVEDNLRHLGLEVLEVVNLRSMLSPHGPVEGFAGGATRHPAGTERARINPPYRPQQRDGKAGRGCAENDAHRLRAKPL